MGERGRIIMAVTSDVVTDQRVLRCATTLSDEGYEVVVVARRLPQSLPLPILPFEVRRLRLLFRKGILFYTCFNIRLFFILLFSRFDIATANDLDTLPGSSLASFVRRKTLVYDSHELFTDLPELAGRPIRTYIWRVLERVFIKNVDAASTVCTSIANEMEHRYAKPFTTIRNVPFRQDVVHTARTICPDKHLLLYQGALNMGRGLESMILAMQFLDGYKLLIAGTGYREMLLKRMVVEHSLQERVTFAGVLPPEELPSITRQADLGLSLEEEMGLSYEYALPNKLFDYIQARVPVLVSPLVEMRRIIDYYKVGTTIDTHNPEHIALVIRNIFEHDLLLRAWRNNCNMAANELCWEREQHKLVQMYNTIDI